MHLSHFPKVALTVAISAVTALALAACSGNSTSGSSASSSASSTSSTDTAAQNLATYENGGPTTAPAAIANMPDLSGKTVWWVPLSNNIPIIQQTGEALTAALKNVGATVHICDGNLVPTTIGSCLTQAANQNAAAVVTGFIDYSMIPSAFDTLQAKKIPTLIAAEPPSAGKTDTSTLAFYSFSKMSDLRMTLAADWAIKDSGGKANILLVRMTDSSATLENAAATASEVKTNCPGCTLTELDMSTATLSRLQSAVGSKLVSSPNIDYIILPLDTDTPQVTAALGAVSKTGKVKISSAGVQFAGLQLVQAGSLNADVGGSIEYSGWATADALFRLMAGEPVGQLDSGTVKVFTADNVKGLNITASEAGGSDWYGGDSWQQGYLTAWGVK